MSFNLRLGIIVTSILLLFIIFIILKKGRMPIKYSLIWFFSSILILLVGLTPQIFINFSKKLGFVTMSNMVVGIFIIILLLITISLTVIVSGQKKKTTLLIQEISLLKEKVNKNEK